MLDKTPLEMALEREGQIEYCDECEYVRVVDNTVFCGLSGKLLHPMMFLRGQGFGPARRCTKRKEAREMGLTAADLQRMGPGAQKQILAKLAKPPAAPDTAAMERDIYRRLYEGLLDRMRMDRRETA